MGMYTGKTSAGFDSERTDHRLTVRVRHMFVFVGIIMLALNIAHPSLARAETTASMATRSVSPSDLDPQVFMDSLSEQYSVSADIVYRTAGGVPLTLDVYQCKATSGAGGRGNPAAIWYHGGGWVGGDKNPMIMRFLPLLRLGFTVVTVNYRLAKQALAPAAVEDSRFAYRWVVGHAAKFNIDPERIVLAGGSAGGHLALMAGMLPVSAGLDHAPGNDPALGVSAPDWWTSAPLPELHPAAIIDFYGITDVDDLIHGDNARSWAIDWIGDASNHDLAARMSPLKWVRPGLPPILMIHGDPDSYVPYSQSVRLKEALDKAGVANRLVRFPGGGHGDFNVADCHRAWEEVRTFLREQKIILNFN